VRLDEVARLRVHPLDVGLELTGLHPPLASSADLDGRQLTGSHQRVGLGRRDVQHLGDVGKLEEPRGLRHSGSVPVCSGFATKAVDESVRPVGRFCEDSTVTEVTPARRLERPSWRDRRLLVGVVLVLASVVVGAHVVGAADDRTAMYAASHPLEPGQRLSRQDLHVVRVRLDQVGARYVAAGSRWPDGAVVLRSVQAGELVPVASLGPPEAVTARPVAVPVRAGAADGLRPGALVDVWVAAKVSGAEAFREPALVVRSAEVVWVSSGGGMISGSSDATVRILLAGDLVAQVLSAVDNGDRVDVVPVPGSVPGGGS
jgi:hypothetical protein